MTDELVKRLREGQTYDYVSGMPRDQSGTMDDAANTIEAQAKLLDQALEALNLVILYDHLGKPCGIANEWEKSIPLTAAVDAIKQFKEQK